MRRKTIFTGLLILFLAGLAMAYDPTWQINFQNCSDPQRLEKLLQDQFGAVRDDLSTLNLQGTGDFYYVDSVTGSASYTGEDWDHPKATLDSAVALCTANNGDIIFVAAGHNEALTGADGVDIDVAGVTVIGLGNGYDRPRFDYDNAAGEFVIGAASVAIYNLQFLPSVNIVTHAIDIENAGSYATISGCSFLNGESAGTDEFVDAITASGTATVITIRNCIYYNSGTGTNSFITFATDNCVIENISAYGAFGNAVIYNAADSPVNNNISNCHLTNTTASQYCIEFSGGSGTGMISDCYLSPATAGYSVDPGVMTVSNVVEMVPGSDISSFIALPWADTSANLFGYDDNNNAYASTNVASNRDGSVLERLEFLIKYFETGTAGALVAPADTRSILDILGSDGTTTTGALAGSLLGAIGTNEAASATAFTSSTAESDRDGSLLERMEFLCKYFETGTPGALVAPANTRSLLDILGSDGTTTTGALAGSLLGAIGTNEAAADTAFTSATAESDRDGSVLERLEFLCKYFETGTPGALVAPANTRSLLDILGSDGTTATGALAGSLLGAIGTNEAIADTPFTSATVTADADGSVLERLEMVQSNQGISYNSPRYFTVPCDLASATWNTVAAHSFVAVTGACRIQFIVEFDTNLVSTSADTLALGFVGNAAGILAATALDDMDAGDVLTVTHVALVGSSPVAGGFVNNGLTASVFDVVSLNGADLIYTISDHVGVSGIIRFHVWWTPLNATGVCAAGAGGTGA